MIFSGLISLLVIVAIPAGIIYAIVKAVRRSPATEAGINDAASGPLPGTGERIFGYILSFAGFMAVLFGLSTLIALALIPVIPGAGALIGADEVRTRISYSLAALIVGAPLWLGLWRYVQGRVAKNPAERNAGERRLYLAAIFGVTAIVALFGAQTAMSALLSLIGKGSDGGLIRDAVTGGSLFAVYGGAWIGYARFGWRERPARSTDWTHDLALYAVTGVSLVVLALGLGNAIHEMIRQMQGANTFFNTTDRWATISGPVASIIVGGAIWWLSQVYDRQRGGARILRVIYLYAAILFAAPVAIFSMSNLFYEVNRRALGYNASDWGFVADTLPWLIVGGAAWAYHWMIIRAQAHLTAPAPHTDIRPPIAYPRRPAYALYTAAGTIMAAVGGAIAIWTGVDALTSPAGALSNGAWWRDSLSLSIVLLLVGGVLWLSSWTVLQRAAAQSPEVEGRTIARRWLLALLSIGAALAGLGFGIALLYQILRAILGQTDAHSLGNALHFGSTMIVALAIAGYYGPLLRATMRQRSEVTPPSRVRLTVLLAPGADTALSTLTQDGAFQITVMGVVTPQEISPATDLEHLKTALSLLGTPGHPDRAFLVLNATGGHVYPYEPAGARNAATQTSTTSYGASALASTP